MQSLSSSVTTPAGFLDTLLSRIPRIQLNSPFFIRLRSWEYWPFSVVYMPVFIYYVWLSIKARSFFFFSASNPAIETGGLLGESKIDILDRISDDYKPKTLFVPAQCHIDGVFE